MSENTGTTGTGTTGTTNGLALDLSDPANQAFVAELIRKNAVAEQRAAEAKEKRIRANGRPRLADGTEMKAVPAYLYVLAERMENVIRVYANDPASGMREMASLAANVKELSATDSTLMGVTADAKRKGLSLIGPSHDATPVPVPQPKK